MQKTQLPEQLVTEIRKIYAQAPASADGLIEDYLENRLTPLGDGAKREILDRMKRILTPVEKPRSVDIDPQNEVVKKLFSLVLGDRFPDSGFSSKEDLTRLAEALNTIFDSLNDLVGVINMALMGHSDASQTIRHLIGFKVGQQTDQLPLEAYLGQIKTTFLHSMEAFQEAARDIVAEILEELDPDRINKETGKVNFGALRKAQCFKLYAHKHGQCKQWLGSKRFSEDVQRKFETCCEKRFAP